MDGKTKISLMWGIITAILIVVIIIIVSLFYSKKAELQKLLDEKEAMRVELKQEVDSLLVAHEAVKYEYGVLSDSLQSRDSIIQANAVEIKKLLDTQWEYYKVKKKLSRLQLIAQGYVRQMDSLYTVNQTLTTENIEMKKDIVVLKQEKKVVEEEKSVLTEQVVSASMLQTYNVIGYGLRYRSGGKVEAATDKAKKVEKIKVCFTLATNEIIEPGPKVFYIRIAQPDKEILTKTKGDEYTFEYEGEMIQYSIVKEVDYDNVAMDVCALWAKQYSSQDMPTGIYHIDIFYDGKEIGHTTFTLK